MEDNLEIFDTIEETPYLLCESNQSTNNNKKTSIINKNNNFNQVINTNSLPNIISINNDIKNNINSIKYEDLILMQRENRKIISHIKKKLSKNINQNSNMNELLIKNILINYKRNISTLYDDRKNTLLHIYVQKNNIEVIKIILKVYSDILHYSREDYYEFIFLKNIDNKTVFDIAIQNNYISAIKILFKQIEEDNNKVKRRAMNYLKNNIFHKCTEYGQCYMVLFFYEKLNNFFKNFNLNKINSKNYKDQMNPLHIACYKGNKKIIKILLDLGIDINSKDTNGYTPLFYAIISKNENLVKMLILRGANKFIKDINNRTPYDLAITMNEYNIVNLLYHRNFCQRQFCGDEITPLVKTKNHLFLLFGLIFTVF